MRQLILASMVAVPLGGCGTVFDPSKLVSASAQTLVSGLKSQAAQEQTLITELQSENEGLKFISKGHYTCGDPRLLAKLVKGDPAKIVARDKIDKHFTDARTFVEGYLKALSTIAAQNKGDQDTTDAVSAMAQAVNGLAAPPIYSTGIKAGISALQTLVKFGITDFNIAQMKYVAIQMEPGLEAAIATLKKLYPSYEAIETKLFRDWDECAVEKLVFIRDLPNREVRTYEQYGYLFSKDGGLELDAAYIAYLNKRKTLHDTPLSDATFDQVVAENKKLIAFDLSVASLSAAADHLATLQTDFQGVVTAVQPIAKGSVKTSTK